MNSKKRILLLPTYFPTKSAPIIGAMVKEQSELMLEFFDVKLIYCMPGMGLRRLITYIVFGKILGDKILKRCDENILNGKLECSGFYYYESKILPEIINQYLKKHIYFRAYKALISTGWEPDLIHSRTAEHAGLQAAFLSKTFKTPNLLTENCIFVLGKSPSVSRITNYRYAIENSTKVAVVSHYLKAFLLSQNYNCNPTIIGNMVDEDNFTLTERNQVTDEFIIFTVGHLGFTKDWQTFFKVIKKLTKDNHFKKIKVIIAITQVYGPSTEAYIRNLAREHDVLQFCDLKFEVSRDKISRLYQDSDLFLSTSVNETFGIATLESMFCGVPVVATRNGGIEDFICDDNGILCDIGDTDALSKAVLSIIKGEKKFFPEKIRNTVVNKYGKEIFKMRLKKLYDETIQISSKSNSVA